MRFSANLGFLWADLPLPDAIRAAAAAGFDAVECHWPYDTDPGAVRAVLEETGLALLGLNTRRGDPAAGDFGLSALPGREAETIDAIDEAIAYARAVGAGHVHVMAGNASGAGARACFEGALRHACRAAAPHGLLVLIEPLNAHDAPGYFLKTTTQAIDIISEIGAPNLKLMFDCYHVGRTEGAVEARLRAVLPEVGHIQFAAVPDRGPPDHGEVDYPRLFQVISGLGWDRPLGAEYRTGGDTAATLGWLAAARRT